MLTKQETEKSSLKSKPHKFNAAILKIGSLFEEQLWL